MLACRNPLTLVTLLLAVATIGSAQSPTTTSPEPPDTSFQSALDHGIAASKAARYDAAIQHFKAAVTLDPASAKAHLYLGTTYAYEVIPNLNTPENLANANNAIAAVKPIPDTAPEYLPALRIVAAAYRNIQQNEAAKKTELHILELDPSDPEAHYTLGSLNWQEAYANALQILAQHHLVDDGNGNPTLERSACLNLRSRNAPLVQDGLDHLTRAIELRPDYADAMQYLNLTYRRHADLACGDEAQRAEDLAQADKWTQKGMVARKQNEASPTTPVRN